MSLPLPKRLIAALFSISTLASASETKDVEIRWTQHDVPHIKANNYESLGFGYGYVLAQDRLCESAGRTIILRGQRSRYYGPDGLSTVGFLKTTNLNSDLAVQLRLHPEWIEAEMDRLQPQTRDYIRGVTAGMNHYVDQLPAIERETICKEEPIPVFEDTDIIRSAMRFGVMKELIDIGPALVASASGWKSGKNSIAANSAHTKPVEVEGGFGSNAWAYGGDFVESDGALLMGNPHSAWKRQPHMQRIYMHQAHLTIPGEIDAAGTGFLGIPMPLSGYNKDVAWSILDAATVSPYVLQAMDVQESDTQPTYRMDGVTKPLEIKPVNIEVLENNGKVVTRTFEFAYSELGLIYKLPEKPGQPAGWYAITNAGEQNASGLDQFLAMARAKSTPDLIKAVEDHRGVLSQLVVADRHGEVGYVVAGNMLPVTDEQKKACRLEASHAGPKIVDGTRRECSFRDNEGNPLQASPDFFPTLITRGIIHNSNNSYKYTEYGKAQPDYPAVFGFHFTQSFPGQKLAAGLRYDPRLIMSNRRLNEITADGIVTPEEATEVIFDNRNYAAETFLDDILSVCESHTAGDLKTACTTLSQWDRKNNSDSRGALLFHQLWNRIVGMQSFLPVNASGKPDDTEKLTITADNAARLKVALSETVQELRELGFAADAPWGTALYDTAENQRIPLHGGSYQEGILNGEMPMPLTKDGFPYILFGTAYVQRIHWEQGKLNANVLLSHGQREHIDSPARTAQLKMFSNKQLYRLPFTQAELADTKMTKTLVLSPNL